MATKTQKPEGAAANNAGVMELVDVADSKSAGGDTVWVRVPPPAPLEKTGVLRFGDTQSFVIFDQVLS